MTIEPVPPQDEALDVIVRLAARGDGVTRDGRYVALAAPGDRVVFALDGTPTIIAGADRAVPPCRHFPVCGGCQLQHVTDRVYIGWMRERIGAALAQSGVAVERWMPPHLSPPRSRRRATLKAVRSGAGAAIGFHAERTHRIVDMRECHVLRPELFALVDPLRALLGRLLPPGQGAGVTATLTRTGVDLLLANVPVDTADARSTLAAFAQAHDLARLSVESAAGVEPIALRRAPMVQLGGVLLAIPPAPFLQATEDGEAALVAAVLDATRGASRVADLFSGLGTFALPLAAAGARVMAVDAAGPALAALAKVGAPRIETLHRDLFRRPLRADELRAFDAVVFDPPRAGAKEQAAELARSQVSRLIAVSCNPPTFARDAALLTAGGYRLTRLWPVGQFRWSSHLELAAEFLR